MVFYTPNMGRGPFPPRARQNVGPAAPFGRPGNPSPFGRQVPFFPQQNPIGGQGNPFYNPNQFGNQGPFYSPNQFGNQGPFYNPNQFGNQGSFFNPNQFGMQDPASYYPNQQFGGSRLGGLNTLMGHVGTVTNGVNMLRQLGSLVNLF